MRLSVLDQSPIPEGSTGADALANTLDLARLCERLGYHRYWLAEHHGGPTLAGPSPEALIGPVAAATSTMRIGSGGVMLPHYSPFKVAETFSLLAGPVPGSHRPRHRPRGGDRPDDDVRPPARPPHRPGPTTSPSSSPSCSRTTRTASRPTTRSTGSRPHLPGAPHQPDVWLLGSSAQSAIWAGQLGLPYAFADFINADGAHIAELYRERFAPARGSSTRRSRSRCGRSARTPTRRRSGSRRAGA